MDDTYYFIDIIDECIKELASQTLLTIELVKLLVATMVEEDEAE